MYIVTKIIRWLEIMEIYNTAELDYSTTNQS